MDRPEPLPMNSFEQDGLTFDEPTVHWGEWTSGWPLRMHFIFSEHRAVLLTPHFLDFPEMVSPFNERYGYLGVRFSVRANGTIGWQSLARPLRFQTPDEYGEG